MPKLHTITTSFAAGQLDDTAQARSDTPVYRNGAAELRNCMPYPSGGVRTRWGSYLLMGPVTAPERREFGTTPIPEGIGFFEAPFVMRAFEFSKTQRYLLVFTEFQVAIYNADAPFDPLTTVFSCPWTAANLTTLRTAQLGDVMWIVHPTWHPVELVRRGFADFILRTMPFAQSRHYPMARYAPTSAYAQVGSGTTATRVTLPSQPQVLGVDTPLYVGQAGRARETAGPGAWKEFVIAGVSGLTITLAWLADPVPGGVSCQWQFEGIDPWDAGSGGAPVDETWTDNGGFNSG